MPSKTDPTPATPDPKTGTKGVSTTESQRIKRMADKMAGKGKARQNRGRATGFSK